MSEYLIYLRKSRADSESETIEEVLARHEKQLQEFALRKLGYRIPEKDIYREVVSGETIEDRPQINLILHRIENKNILGVITIEPQRLTRGDMLDCGTIVHAFRYSNTLIMTPNKTYDLSDKFDRKFFEMELSRGNDYLEYTKEILLRGRVLSVQKGNYIGNIAPFGYDKAEIDGCPSLKPNEDADYVRLIFDMYVNQGKTYLQIARHLDSIGVKPMYGEIWEKCSIRNMLKNEHYAGYVRFGGKKTEKIFEDGKVTKRRGIPAEKEDVIIAKGKQEALVTQEIFDAAQEKMNNNPRHQWDAPLKNPLAGIFWCKKCGRAMKQHPYKHAKHRYECGNRVNCNTKSVKMDEIHDAIILALENEKLPELEVHLKNNDGLSAAIQKKQLDKMNAELEELQKQEEKQYDLLEKGIYSEDKFIERNKALIAEMESLKTKIFNAKKEIPKEVDYGERIVKLKDAIAALRSDDLTPQEKNVILKTIIDRIEYELISYEGRGKVRYALHIFLLI